MNTNDDNIDVNDCNSSKLLNDDWIVQFEQNDKLYQDFYKENIYYTNLLFFYVNGDFEIVKIKQEPFLMSIPNCITKQEMQGIILNAQVDNKVKYKLLSVIKYNINLNSEDVHLFLNNTDVFNFFTPVNAVSDVYFDKSIQMFHDLNDLIIIFHEKSNNNNNKTRRNNRSTINNIQKKCIKRFTRRVA
jgi:hypothetical protein